MRHIHFVRCHGEIIKISLPCFFWCFWFRVSMTIHNQVSQWDQILWTGGSCAAIRFFVVFVFTYFASILIGSMFLPKLSVPHIIFIKVCPLRHSQVADPLINLVSCDVEQNDEWDQFQVLKLPKTLMHVFSFLFTMFVVIFKMLMVVVHLLI